MNIKQILFIDDFSVLTDEYLMLNFKVAGSVLKGDLNKVKKLVENLSSDQMKSIVSEYKKDNDICIEGFEIPSKLFSLASKDKENIVRSETDIQVAINTKIDDTLRAEGIYRMILRNCQIIRKEAGFDVSDRVKLCLVSEANCKMKCRI